MAMLDGYTPGGASLPMDYAAWMRPNAMSNGVYQPTTPNFFQLSWLRGRQHHEWSHSPVDISPNPPVHIAPEPFIRPSG
jgi:hypothetical protein